VATAAANHSPPHTRTQLGMMLFCMREKRRPLGCGSYAAPIGRVSGPA
jgi:hypothetical protein